MNPFDQVRAERDEARRELESLRNAVFEVCGHLPGVSQEGQLKNWRSQLELIRVALGAETPNDMLEQADELRNRLEKFNSPTGPIVLWFAGEMEKKLAANRHKGNQENWRGCPPEELLMLFDKERLELGHAVERALMANQTGATVSMELLEAIVKESADVANFAMMIADQAKEALRANAATSPPAPLPIAPQRGEGGDRPDAQTYTTYGLADGVMVPGVGMVKRIEQP